MSDTKLSFDVIIVGGGPSGLSAATELKRLGVASVLVLEREKEAGGIPRHCLHSPYGLREWKRPMFGPAYARRLTQEAQNAGAEIRCKVTVTALGPGGVIEVSSNEGMQTLTGRAVLLAMGARETSRSARLVGGTKPAGVMNTATLQNFAAFSKQMPFKRPIIIGTELVSFSALLTCRSLGIKPVAMLEESSRITARSACALLPNIMRVPLHFKTQITKINGARNVSSVNVLGPNGSCAIDCDGVIFTGKFRPENALLRSGGFDVDPGSLGPEIDQYGRLSDPSYFSAGNVLRGIETAGWCWNEGRKVARCIMAGLRGVLPERGALDVSTAPSITIPEVKFSIPQVISPGQSDVPAAFDQIQLRLSSAYAGEVPVGTSTYTISSKPERRILLPLSKAPAHQKTQP